MGFTFWFQLIAQIIIAFFAIRGMLRLEKVRPTKDINPKTLDDTIEL